MERFPGIPVQITSFHWHGDTFDLPAGAIPLAYSENTSNQAFLYKNNILGIQFHPEMKPENIRLMINYGSNELIAGPFVQSASELADGLGHMPGNRAMLEMFLDYLESTVSQQKST
jgi:GMP synthase (glutamine-hydrolysing)